MALTTLGDTRHCSSWEDAGRANDNGSTLTVAPSAQRTEVGASPPLGHNFLATRLLPTMESKRAPQPPT